MTQLRKELLSNSVDSALPAMNEAYLTERFEAVRAIVRGEVLRQLNANVTNTDDIRTAILPIAQDQWAAPVSVIRSSINGLKIVVVGYSILYGPSALPNSKMVIEAVRDDGNGYTPIAVTGEALSNSLARLEALPSARPEQLWILAHGQETVKMQYSEKMRIYSFDGVQFKELWSPDPKVAPQFTIGKSSLQITYELEPGKRGTRMMQVLSLTPAGVLEAIPIPEN